MNRLRGNASLYLPVVSHLSDPQSQLGGHSPGRTLTWKFLVSGAREPAFLPCSWVTALQDTEALSHSVDGGMRGRETRGKAQEGMSLEHAHRL